MYTEDVAMANHISNDRNKVLQNATNNFWDNIKNFLNKRPVEPCSQFRDIVTKHHEKALNALNDNPDFGKCFNKDNIFNQAFKEHLKNKSNGEPCQLLKQSNCHSTLDLTHQSTIQNTQDGPNVMGKNPIDDSTDH